MLPATHSWQLSLLLIPHTITKQVVCTNSTKGLGLHWSVVTFAQLLISSMCGFIGIPVLGLVKYQPIKNRDQFMQTSLLVRVLASLFFLSLSLSPSPPPPPLSLFLSLSLSLSHTHTYSHSPYPALSVFHLSL
jgi:hypothetical protein